MKNTKLGEFESYKERYDYRVEMKEKEERETRQRDRAINGYPPPKRTIQ